MKGVIEPATRVASGPGAEPTYCFCNNVSYGDMIACDNEACLYEWFHFPCIGISEKPQKGSPWYCQKCAPSFQKPKHPKKKSNFSIKPSLLKLK